MNKLHWHNPFYLGGAVPVPNCFNRAPAIVAIQWMDINGHYEVGINNALKDVRALEQDSTVE